MRTRTFCSADSSPWASRCIRWGSRGSDASLIVEALEAAHENCVTHRVTCGQALQNDLFAALKNTEVNPGNHVHIAAYRLETIGGSGCDVLESTSRIADRLEI